MKFTSALGEWNNIFFLQRIRLRYTGDLLHFCTENKGKMNIEVLCNYAIEG